MTTIDLAALGKEIKSTENQIAIQGPGDAAPVDLKAIGPGPNYSWSLFAIRNASDHDLELVLQIDPQNFVGSGLIALRPVGDAALNVVTTSVATNLAPISQTNSKAFGFTLTKNQTLNIAIETNGQPLQARLLQRSFFEYNIGRSIYFRGVILGAILLLTLGILSLYGYRSHHALLAAWFFAISGLIFIVFATNEFPSIIQYAVDLGLSLGIIRAVVETVFALSLVTCLLAFRVQREQTPLMNLGFYLFITLLLANIAFAFVDADKATSFARLSFGVSVLLGTLITWFGRRMESGHLYFWLFASAWALIAAVSAQPGTPTQNATFALSAGLAIVLMALALSLLRFVFTQGLSNKPFITDASRRSLALSSARHILWDWQIQDDYLDVGEELNKALGYSPQAQLLNNHQNFRELMHPVDAASYETEIEKSKLQAGRSIDLELRLRNSEGQYRWYELRSRVTSGPNQLPDRCIGTLTDVTKAKEIEERLIADAVHDPVTGLPSRAVFMDRLQHELGKPITLQWRVLLIDVDRFKTINDALGHDQGDHLLQLIGSRIQNCLNENETVARISGSQFSVMAVEGIGQRTGEELAEIIGAALAEPIAIEYSDIVLSCSIGISNASERGSTANDLQQQAASALLEARRLGGSQTIVFDSNLKDDRASHLALESDLRRALASDEIEVQFQPIVTLVNQHIVGLEALARWRHPSKGLLSPIEFIDMAEQAGMIGEIGQIVLATAARQLGIWQRVLRRDDDFFVSVNVSPSHFLQRDFLEHLQIIIERESLKSNSLKIEVTESVIIRHPERAAKLFDQLRSLGVGLACDDFGTGFSNLSSLRDLPFDTLKIDRSFLTPESFDTRSGMIISTITELAHGLGMKVVAEGIEHQSQIDRLIALGCDLGQGYFIGEPKSANELTDSLAVLPRFTTPPPIVVSNYATQISGPSSALWPLDRPKPGRAPLAPRLNPKPPEPELEVLPSIFGMSPKEEPKPAKKAKPRKSTKRAKKV